MGIRLERFIFFGMAQIVVASARYRIDNDKDAGSTL